MLRDKSLIPLSHQHQHALALCVRIDRASPIPDADLSAWQSEIAQEFRSEIAVHFAAEEQILFPVAKEFKELSGLVIDLLSEHVVLRGLFSRAESQRLSAGELTTFARQLSQHIRKEERQLFEIIQQLLSAKELSDLGGRLDMALKDAGSACALPNNATKLRSAK
jgi:hemerythrin-like domain-containing protein